MATQLTLPVRLRDDALFANFYPGDNTQLLAVLTEFVQAETTVDPYIYLWGHAGAGCSHLLQACCQRADQKGLRTMYLPLAELTNADATILEGLEHADLICIDDIQTVLGKPTWEEALFNFYNRSKMSGAHLLLAGNNVPSQLNFLLPDLKSRLASGLIFQVHVLNDVDQLAALQLRAKIRGMELSDEVGEFLLHRIARDGASLFTALEKLDQVSLSAQRKLTIPFVKTVLRL